MTILTANVFDRIGSIEDSVHFELSNEDNEDVVLPFVDNGTLDIGPINQQKN